MKPKFKAGDKVVRIDGSHKKMKVGDIDIVLHIEEGDEDMDLVRFGTGHSIKNFRLVKQNWKKVLED